VSLVLSDLSGLGAGDTSQCDGDSLHSLCCPTEDNTRVACVAFKRSASQRSELSLSLLRRRESREAAKNQNDQ